MNTSEGMSPDELRDVLADLAETLRRRGVDAELTIVGGAAMTLAYGADRLTRDVDGRFWPKGEVLAAAREVAARHRLDPQWLNNGAEAWMPEDMPQEHRRVVVDHPALVVTEPGARPLLAMKLRASRHAKDVEDASLLFKAAGLTSAADAERVFREYYPDVSVTERHRRVFDHLHSTTVRADRPPAQRAPDPRTGPVTGGRTHPSGPVTGPDGGYGSAGPDSDISR